MITAHSRTPALLYLLAIVEMSLPRFAEFTSRHMRREAVLPKS